MSGCAAPARTPIATGEVTTSMRGPSRCPSAINESITLGASTTASNASPPRTRLAASTPPTDSTRTRKPESDSNRAARSASTCRVAIDDTM
jgi:hypothetical protein